MIAASKTPAPNPDAPQPANPTRPGPGPKPSGPVRPGPPSPGGPRYVDGHFDLALGLGADVAQVYEPSPSEDGRAGRGEGTPGAVSESFSLPKPPRFSIGEGEQCDSLPGWSR